MLFTRTSTMGDGVAAKPSPPPPTGVSVVTFPTAGRVGAAVALFAGGATGAGDGKTGAAVAAAAAACGAAVGVTAATGPGVAAAATAIVGAGVASAVGGSVGGSVGGVTGAGVDGVTGDGVGTGRSSPQMKASALEEAAPETDRSDEVGSPGRANSKLYLYVVSYVWLWGGYANHDDSQISRRVVELNDGGGDGRQR